MGRFAILWALAIANRNLAKFFVVTFRTLLLRPLLSLLARARDECQSTSDPSASATRRWSRLLAFDAEPEGTKSLTNNPEDSLHQSYPILQPNLEGLRQQSRMICGCQE